jgi:uncharacterized membrane protein YedE/YeeE
MGSKLGSVHRKHALLLTLAAIGSILYGWVALGSLLLGGGIQVINLRALDRTASRLRDFARGGSPGPLRALLAFRFVLIVGLVGWVLLRLPVQPGPFVVGLGLIVPAVLWHGLETARQRSVEGR